MSRFKPAGIAPVNLDGQADGDYIRNDAGIWKPKNAGQVLSDLLPDSKWDTIRSKDYSVTGTTGSGALLQINPFYIYAGAGATANSTARFRVYRLAGFSRGTTHSTIDFDKLICWKIRVHSANVTTATGIIWAMWGGSLEDAAPADPTSKAIGIKIIGTAIHGLVHDGTNMNTVDLTTAYSRYAQDILIVSQAGNVKWYIDDVYKGESNDGPTGLSAASECTLGFGITNGANEADHRLYVHDGKIYVEA